MCDQFSDYAREYGFTVYSETSGFDLLLVAGDACKGFKLGDQIGVQAKLKSNLKVLSQALPPKTGCWRKNGPHYYVVLVPYAPSEFVEIARYLEITVIDDSCWQRTSKEKRDYYLYAELGDPSWRVPAFKACNRYYRHSELDPCWIPDCEIIGWPAGVPAPRQLTKWKMSAIKLCMHGELNGYLTRKDFVKFDLHYGLWLKRGWIVPYDSEIMEGRRIKRYVLNAETVPPHLLYHELTDAMVKAGVVG